MSSAASFSVFRFRALGRVRRLFAASLLLIAFCSVDVQAQTHSTVTTASGSPNPASTSATATITANVTSDTTVNAGSVTFVDDTTTIGSANVTNGVATLSNIALVERTHRITANYGGTSTGTIFGSSSGTFDIRFDHPTTESGINPYAYCNVGAVAVPGLGANAGVAAPYPSNIVVSSLPGTVKGVTVTLKQFGTNDQNDFLSLLVGPGGNNLDFFSLTGRVCAGAACEDTVGPFSVTFDDTASTSLIGSDVIAGTFKPTSLNAAGGVSPDAPVAYPACPPNATDCSSPPVGPPLPADPFTPTHKAAAAGTSILGNSNAAGVFGGTTSSTYNGNGVWSLYLDDANHGAGRSSNLAGGWCLNFTENLPAATATKSHTGPAPNNHFRQGAAGQFSFVIQNNGPGPTGDVDGNHPLTVTDTLATALAPGSSLPTGVPWDCSAVGQTITCKNHNAIAPGSAYPTLTIPVTVADNAGSSVNNQASISGAGITSTTTNTDTVTIDPAPVLSIAKSHTGTFMQGSTANWTLQVANNAATTAGTTDGSTVTVSDTLPTGYTFASFTGTGWSCGGSTTVTCTSTLVIAGAGGAFPLITLTVNVPANSPTSVSNTAGVFGGGDLIHTNAGTAATSSDTVGVVQVPASITINAGATQHAAVNQNFGTALAVTVKDAGAVIVPNYSSVTFTAQPGSSGQSGTFTATGVGTRTLSTDANGVANAGTFTANANAGAYTVDVSAGAAPHVAFNLSNFAPPTLGKTFNPTSIAHNGTSTLTFTATNSAANPGALSGVAFGDTLPSSVTVSTPNGLTGSCGGGAITAMAGSGSVSLSGATLASGASCSFAVNVTSNSLGSKVNVTGNVASSEGGVGGMATATLSVKTTTSVTLATACPKTFVADQPFTMTASVSGNSPTGTVVFDDGAIGIGGCLSVTLSAGTANCDASNLGTGLRDLIAGYSGDDKNLPGDSASLFVTVLDPADALFLDGFEQTVAGCPID